MVKAKALTTLPDGFVEVSGGRHLSQVDDAREKADFIARHERANFPLAGSLDWLIKNGWTQYLPDWAKGEG